MSGYEVRIAGLDALVGFLRGIVKTVRAFAFAAALGVAAIAALLARGGFETVDAVVVVLLLLAPALLLFFAAGVGELLRLPERLRRLPTDSTDQLTELRRIAGDARRTGFRGAPRLLWRLRGAVGSTRDLVGFALPLRVLTPAFLGLTLVAGLFCTILVGAGAIALVVLALG